MSIYDIAIKSIDGEENFLDQFKGKVSLIVNVTGDCGNAPQYGILETMYRKYKDQGFEIIAVPTNDFCGVGLTYGEHAYGTDGAPEAKQFAEDEFNVTYPFTEMVESNPAKADLIPGLPSKHGKVTPHELFKNLVDGSDKALMGGNFEKYLVGKDGKVIKRYPNNYLLNYNYDSWVEGSDRERGIPADEAYLAICNDIESALAV
jgi:glutathione peroxidase